MLKPIGIIKKAKRWWLKRNCFSIELQAQHLTLAGIVGTADPRDANFKKILKLTPRTSPLFRGIRKMAAYHEDPKIHAWTDKSTFIYQYKIYEGF